MPAVSWCRAARSSAAILTVLWLLAPSAHAQEATPPPAPAASAEAARPLFAGVHWGIGSSFAADSPSLFLAGNSDAFLFGGGLILAYDGNLPTDKTHAALVLSAAYMLHNQFPFAMGPEIDFVPQIAPSAFNTNSVSAGWAFWYAPWNIPCIIGTAAFVNFAFASGKSAVVTTVTPAVRIVFGFK
jgi:hypothetical protein